MANYNESSITGTKWTRSKGGVFNNPYQGMPNIIFYEEDVVALGDGTIIKPSVDIYPAPSVSAYMHTPSKEFDVLDPSTGAVTGTATYQQVFTILHSLYISLANERDAPAVVPDPLP